MMPTYRLVATVTAAMALTLALTLVLWPALIFWLMGVAQDPGGTFIARRAATLFLGLAVLAIVSRTAPPSDLRRGIAAAFCVSMAALAMMGVIEYARGIAGPGIWVAIAIESAIAASFLIFWRGPDRP